MYTIFSEALRKTCMSFSLALKKIASGSYKYLGTYYDKAENNLMVQYRHNNQYTSENYKTFIHSCYFNMLSGKQATDLFKDIHTYKQSKKRFELFQDSLVPELFNLKNTATGKAEEKLLKDIINDDYILENLPGSQIKVLILAYAHLMHNKEDQKIVIEKDGKIIHLNRENKQQ
ncbi:MAG: hypothetical protein A3E87_03995 [Gammaproteobacteria bacterium RIFCSPHIGHO2_12_FULL_35_23]|nr:MAG: hypothetical protein A3E87_03995 [Gammaproteobacteria bacterium RIFCSPHIGHO2_12_FULL_35_23]